MCRVATCQKCSKATWAGCGNHVDQVMKNVPESRRCTCSTAPARPSVTQPGAGLGWIAKLLGR